MPQITVVYGPHELEDFDRAHQAPFAWSTLSDIRDRLRNHLKHGDESQDRARLQEVFEAASEALREVE